MAEDLYTAARNGDLAEVKQLVKDEGVAVDVRGGGDNWTPLMTASCEGNKDVVDFLLLNKADVNARNDYCITAMLLAAMEGHVEVVEALAGGGGRVGAVGDDGRTALHYAAKEGHLTTVQTLLTHGAEPGVKAKDGSTAGDMATQEGHHEVADVLEEATRGDSFFQ